MRRSPRGEGYEYVIKRRETDARYKVEVFDGDREVGTGHAWTLVGAKWRARRIASLDLNSAPFFLRGEV